MKPFLTAEWKNLIMVNFPVAPEFLKPLVPAGTELDFFNGVTYVSLVGFQFLETRVKGFRIPFHVNFPEVNLRFYVRRDTGSEVRRGVVFIRELVPRWAISTIANLLYKENYQALPMKMEIGHYGGGRQVQYSVRKKDWSHFRVEAGEKPSALIPGSEQEFIAEHYWGYARRDANSSTEYRVEHPPWRVFPVDKWENHLDIGRIYGRSFAERLVQPASVFLAEGSEVAVYPGRILHL